MMRLAFELASACASVLATMKSTPCSPASIMLLTALPPAPPTPNTTMRAFISRISVMPVIFPSRCSGKLGMERVPSATCKPRGLLPRWPRPDVPIEARLVPRSSHQLGARSAEPPLHLPIVPPTHWLPSSRRPPAAAQQPGDRRARARARNLLYSRLPLLLAAGFPPSMPRSLPWRRRCGLPGDHVVGGAHTAVRRNQRSPRRCHHPNASAATGVVWQANERPLARF